MDKNKLQLMWVVGFIPKKMGSFEETMIYMAKEAEGRGFGMSFVFPGEPIREFKNRLFGLNAKVIVLPIKNRLDINFMRKIVFLSRLKKIDILHSHFDLANFPISFTRYCYKRPLYFWHQHNFVGTRLPLVRRMFYKYLSGVATKIIAISEAVKKDLISKGVAEDGVEVIYNGVNLEKFQINFSDEIKKIKNELGISENSIVISCIGEARPEKGQLFLLKAFSRIIGKFPYALLLLVGSKSGSFFETLKEEAGKLDIKNKVIFTEVRSDVPQILYITDLLVIPSTMEGLSYIALEAMASCKPVIASRIGGIPEVVKDGETGILVTPRDIEALSEAITYLILNPLVREKMGKVGYKIVEGKFNIKCNIKQLSSLYEQMIQNEGLNLSG